MPSPLLIFANLDRSFFPFIHLVNVPKSMPSDFTYYRRHSTNLSSSSSLVVSLLYNAHMLKISTSKNNIKKNLPVLLSFPHGINGWASLFPTPHQLFMTVITQLINLTNPGWNAWPLWHKSSWTPSPTLNVGIPHPKFSSSLPSHYSFEGFSLSALSLNIHFLALLSLISVPTPTLISHPNLMTYCTPISWWHHPWKVAPETWTLFSAMELLFKESLNKNKKQTKKQTKNNHSSVFCLSNLQRWEEF